MITHCKVAYGIVMDDIESQQLLDPGGMSL